MLIHLCALQVYLHCTILVLIKFSSISCIFDAGSIVCSVLSSLVKPVCSTFDLRTLHILSCLSPFHSFHSSSVPTWILYVLLMVCLSLLFGLLNQVFYTMSSWKDSLLGGAFQAACVALYMTQSISQKIAVSPFPILRMHFFYHGVTHALPLLGYPVFSLCIYSLGFFLLVLTICYPLG